MGWVLAGACALDMLVGDPGWLPHPVRVIGAAIDGGERRLNAGGCGSRAVGTAFALTLVAISAGVGWLAQQSFAASIVLGASTLAARDLLGEAARVARALERRDLERARMQVARIVGRDTAGLDTAGVARAAIESVGESICDAIVAPVFWFAVGGVPAALAFKTVSTLDSMIGHRTARFERFGWCSARLDDALNYVPARLAAAIIALAGGAFAPAARVAFAGASAHASPNAGWPEASLAGALGVQLGGVNTYDGVVVNGPVFNRGARLPTARDLRRAIRITAIAAGLAYLGAILIRS